MCNWFSRLRQTPQKQRRVRPASFRPSLECLEERSLLDAGMVGFIETALISDLHLPHTEFDKNLVNPWGFAETPQGQFQVSLNGSGLSQLLNAQGDPIGPPVVLPPPPGQTGPTSPNGAVLNTTNDFVITENGKSAPATFLVSTEDGTIVGFNPQLDPTHAVIFADQSAAGAVYKLLAEANVPGEGSFLYATNFHNGTVDVFDSSGHLVKPGTDGFSASAFTDPTAPADFAPFGIKLVNVPNQGNVFFVTYAKQDGAKHDDVEGAGNGFIDMFDTSGNYLGRFASGSAAGGTAPLDSPIGMAVAPPGFGPHGEFSGALLVGNFGDSHVSAFSLQPGLKFGQFLGQLSDPQGHPLVLNGGVVNKDKPSDTKGLWGIAFGNGQGGTDPNTLYFAAGVHDEKDGVFGKVTMTDGDHDHDDHPSPSTPPSNPGQPTGLQAVEMALQKVLTDLAQLQSQLAADLRGSGMTSPAMLLMSDPMLAQDLTQLMTDEVALETSIEQTLLDEVMGSMASAGSMGM